MNKLFAKHFYKFRLFESYNSKLSRLYYITPMHRIVIIVLDISIFLGVSFIFYNSIIPGALLSLLVIPLYNLHYEGIIEKRKFRLELQFKDMLNSINAALAAGYSIENATKEAYLEMLSIYGDNSFICTEISVILNQLNLGSSVEKAYNTFASRCLVDSVTTFSEILTISKRSSGDLSSIIRTCITTLHMKIDSDREVRTTLSSKIFERNIMIFMPALIILYVSFSSPGFFDPLYATLAGRIIMTLCLGIYLFAIWLSVKIFRKEAM